MIDLSGIEPESLGPLHLEEIPPCTFTEKGRPYKPKTKKNKKKWRKEEEHRGRRKSEHQEKEKSEKKLSEDHGEVDSHTQHVVTHMYYTYACTIKWVYIYYYCEL